jgi:Spy/CpxP family protein refolding chaperone
MTQKKGVNLMKKIIVLLAVVLIAGASLACAAGTGQAFQDVGATHGQQMGPRQGGMFEMMGALNLTDDQKAKIKNIMEEQMAKMQEIRDAAQSQIEAVLTPEQNTKLDQLRKEAQEKMKARMEEYNKKAVATGNSAVK